MGKGEAIPRVMEQATKLAQLIGLSQRARRLHLQQNVQKIYEQHTEKRIQTAWNEITNMVRGTVGRMQRTKLKVKKKEKGRKAKITTIKRKQGDRRRPKG